MNLSPEARQKISEAVKKQWADPVFGQKCREAIQQRSVDPVYRQKMSKAAKDPLRRQKISKAMKQRWADASFRQKHHEAMERPEFRQRISVISKERWADPEYRQRMSAMQRGPRGSNWRGGLSHCNGYVLIWRPSHPRADKKGYVWQHILAWEEAHSSLPAGWLVHHLNGIKDDNRVENLVAVPKKCHHSALVKQAMQKRIRKLEADNLALRTQKRLGDL